VLRNLPAPNNENLLVGSENSDDAAVWLRPGGDALIATADFFTPIVDDAGLWGQISAANAVSDIYAMGGKPLFALNLVAWPRDELELEILEKVLLGGQTAAEAGSWVIAGGHTVDGPEPMYGMSVVGEVAPDAVITNGGGVAGQSLVLTKPIGTGLLATAIKRSDPEAITENGWLSEIYKAGVREMTRLNAQAAEAAQQAKATAATDITGFGLLGHLYELAKASGLSASIDTAAVPLLPDVRALVEGGFVAGGTDRNLAFLEPFLDGGSSTNRLILADAQTSGGLIFSCDSEAAQAAVLYLRDSGHDAAIVGVLESGEPGHILLQD
jgi:selenide,water dikinase|tara:strand:- start:19307 stop:20284 length:978 start_codon:yes stop_codon:yes gene_type:complete